MPYSSRNKTLYSLLLRKETIFALPDVALFLNEDNTEALQARMQNAVKKGVLLNPRKGIYAKPDYSPLELACKLYTPSYLSLEYIMQRDGVIFQYDPTITMVSYLSREVSIEGNIIRYRKIKGEIMIAQEGIVRRNNVNEATKERAFLDTLYLSPNYYFDNINALDYNEVMRILPIYKSKTLERRVTKIFSHV